MSYPEHSGWGNSVSYRQVMKKVLSLKIKTVDSARSNLMRTYKQSDWILPHAILKNHLRFWFVKVIFFHSFTKYTILMHQKINDKSKSISCLLSIHVQDL